MEGISPIERISSKMQAEGLGASAIASMLHSYESLASGATGMIQESEISSIDSLPHLDVVGPQALNSFSKDLLKQVVVIKLNGGLGTSMGLDRPKSLLPLKESTTFLDFIAEQLINLREQYDGEVRCMLLNSFSTTVDTMTHMKARYPNLIADNGSGPALVELIQNKVPKIDKSTLLPVEWSANPSLEWCPPGHGDLYTALYESGHLAKLVNQGVKYAFVSNSDNLGATLDLGLLSYFAQKNVPFLMECAARTEADKKGGHLAMRVSDNQLILRESAQCPKSDSEYFEDVTRHRFFNTNNLWIRLDSLLELFESSLKNSGKAFLPLPCIFNSKPVDPQQDSSTPVWQLETAMGAAIELFDGAAAICVPRTRFAPVKKCSDLLLLRSDAYDAVNGVLVQSEKSRKRKGDNIVAPPTIVSLDDKKYKLVQALDIATRYGVPSLAKCDRLKVVGQVWFSSGNIFEGDVELINTSEKAVFVPPGVYRDTVVGLSFEDNVGPLQPTSVPTTPYTDQKPGTSGLRKKTRRFMESMYLENFVQATFHALASAGVDFTKGSLVIGGDGRYYCAHAIQTIIKVSVANGVRSIIIGQNGLLSTPAVSAIIREYSPKWKQPFGSFILTASHNPGGLEEDFGIKYNGANGGPAPEILTDAIYENTRTLSNIWIAKDFPDMDLSTCGMNEITSDCGNLVVQVEVLDPTSIHVSLLKSIFDFKKLKDLVAHPQFSMYYDCMHGVQGPYAHAVFVNELGLPEDSLLNAVPSESFGGHHADPNLTYARDLCDLMGIDDRGEPKTAIIDGKECTPRQFGAACDGDADRNMIVGSQFFVSPSDSLAILTAHANLIPYFRALGGLRSVARSMPTSGAVDRVAERLGLHLFETPTGWKFFGNVMDAHLINPSGPRYSPVICGEESFGTGSDHIREKDGLWAVLAWMQILAHYNSDPSQPFVSVESIVRSHWEKYGRNYYTRYDYEGVASDAAAQVMNHLRKQLASLAGKEFSGNVIRTADEFEYTDPIDHSVSKNQGIRICFTDNSRIIFRLSGTSGSGATIRVYIEKYDADDIASPPGKALSEFVKIALQISDLVALTGRESPSVIT